MDSEAEKELRDRLESLEGKVTRLSSKVEALTDCYLSLSKLVMNRVRDAEEDIEVLNGLCKFSFKTAFNRIGRLERGERVNDMGWDKTPNDAKK